MCNYWVHLADTRTKTPVCERHTQREREGGKARDMHCFNSHVYTTYDIQMWMFIVATILITLLQPTLEIGEEGTMTGNTYHVRGKIIMKEDTTTRPADILQQCFYGVGFVNCEHKGDLPRLPPYPFNPKSKFVAGNNYCIECKFLQSFVFVHSSFAFSHLF